MLFGIQNLREMVDSGKHVKSKENLHKELTGQSSTLYKLLKTHPSEKHKPPKFDEYILFDSQIDWLAKVMTKLICDLKVE